MKSNPRVVSRRHVSGLIVLLLGSIIGPAGPAHAQVQPGEITVELQLVAAGLTSPVVATHAGDGSGRLFVVDRVGRIRILVGGVLLPEPFLDLSDEIVALDPFFDERGLLGLAFHPDYACNGRFFVRYSRAREGSPGEPCFDTPRGCHEEVLAEYHVSENDPDSADPGGTILFRIDEPQFNHDAGHVAFGPDGYLYFTLGDGGGAHDGLADVPPSHGPIGNGQNIQTALGAILRIDVDAPPQAPLAYAIPPDNPFVGQDGLDEIYAYGLRNPYRFSFDSGDDEGDDEGGDSHATRVDPGSHIASHLGTDPHVHLMRGSDGDLPLDSGGDCGADDELSDEPFTIYLADVGQARFEEIDVIERAGNYGWVIREGTDCFDPLNPLDPPESCPTTGARGEPLIDPIAQYGHDDGLAVIGGFVYRGQHFPQLQGKYVFGDFSRAFVPGDGRIFYIDLDNDPSEILEFRLGPDNAPLGKYVLGFGEREDGELYLLTSETLGPSGESGQVFRILVVEGDDDEDGDEGGQGWPDNSVNLPASGGGSTRTFGRSGEAG